MIELKTPQEITDINQDLHLFDERDWSFLDVVNQDNAEYFDDVMDYDFADDTVLSKRVKATIPFVIVACISVIVMSVSVTLNNITSKSTYEKVASAPSEESYVQLKRVNGVEASNSEQIACGAILTGYIGCLEKFDTQTIKTYITDSTITSTYDGFRKNIEYNYDRNDCSARILKAFAEQCSLDTVNDVIRVGDKYYCYVNLKVPTKDRVVRYVHSIRYVLMKKFNNNKPTRETVIPYLVELMGKEAISDTDREYCFVIQDNKVTDDSTLYQDLTEGYEKMLSEVGEIVGTKLSKG